MGLNIIPMFHKEKVKPDHAEKKTTGLKYIVSLSKISLCFMQLFSFGTSAKNVIFPMTFARDTCSL